MVSKKRRKATPTDKRVLLIDDEPDMNEVLGQILNDAGYRVLTAQTGAVGLAKFQRMVPSVPFVVLDLRLPDMSGLDVLERIHALAPQKTTVLMVTAFGSPEAKKQAKARGAMAVLDKPFRIEKILKSARLAFERVK